MISAATQFTESLDSSRREVSVFVNCALLLVLTGAPAMEKRFYFVGSEED